MRDLRWLLSLSAGMTVVLSGCVTTPPPPPPPPPPPRFDFRPPSKAHPNSAGVTFALVSPSYSEHYVWTRMPPFTDLCGAMADDFEELLAARGFTTKGPYAAYEEMTFPDKRVSDLVLIPSLELAVDILDTRLSQEWGGPLGLTPLFRQVGTAHLSGRVTLSVNETLSRERMWFKSLRVPAMSVAWTGEKQYMAVDGTRVPPVPRARVYSDPGFRRAIKRPLEDIYRQIFDMAWKHLHPEEMRLIKRQAIEIKQKFGFTTITP